MGHNRQGETGTSYSIASSNTIPPENQTTDIFLNVFAPWCGHCRKLKPDWGILAKKIYRHKLHDKIKICSMDGTANDSTIDTVVWTGFPTLLFFKKGVNRPLSYNQGDRSATALYNFVVKNTSFKDSFQNHADGASVHKIEPQDMNTEL